MTYAAHRWAWSPIVHGARREGPGRVVDREPGQRAAAVGEAAGLVAGRGVGDPEHVDVGDDQARAGDQGSTGLVQGQERLGAGDQGDGASVGSGGDVQAHVPHRVLGQRGELVGDLVVDNTGRQPTDRVRGHQVVQVPGLALAVTGHRGGVP
ncbi:MULTISPECIES: hypothetical protein [Arsenicicoccus]|uniref:hypothetical protein n=1 Tax=Arsenicicoccus TaxID=267408 RepID=UPI000492EAA6|nr:MULTISPECIES: hypothetical protein [Arsenicicoccus]